MALKHEMQFKSSLFIVGKQYLRPLMVVSALVNVTITKVRDSSSMLGDSVAPTFSHGGTIEGS